MRSRPFLPRKGIDVEEQEEEMLCNTCGKKMKKKPVKTPLGSFDHWICSFCHA